MTYSGGVSVSSGMKIAPLQRRISFSSVDCPNLTYFYILSHKLQDFLGKKVIEYKMCVCVCVDITYNFNLKHISF